MKATQKDLQALRLERLVFEAKELASHSKEHGKYRLALALFENRPIMELRTLVDELRKQPGMIAVLANFDGQKLSLVVACTEDSEQSAQDILRTLLQPLNGRGGGDRSIAQGGGAASADQAKEILRQARSLLLASPPEP